LAAEPGIETAAETGSETAAEAGVETAATPGKSRLEHTHGSRGDETRRRIRKTTLRLRKNYFGNEEKIVSDLELPCFGLLLFALASPCSNLFDYTPCAS
jgi:hypothetical protein